MRKMIITLVAVFACCLSYAQTSPEPDNTPYITDLSKVEVLGRIPIFFERRSLEVQEMEGTEVKEIIRLLDAHPDYMLELHGWCSPMDKDEDNEYRSFYRANSVGKYLVAHGLDGRRIIDVDGFGADKSVTDKDLYDSARRVDILIVKELK